jgi:hypothetical protein
MRDLHCVHSADGIAPCNTSNGVLREFAKWKEASVTLTNAVKSNRACRSHKYLEWSGVPLLHRNETIVMANCQHNVFNSIHNRYLMDPGCSVKRSLDFKFVYKIVDDLVERLRPLIRPFDEDAFLHSKKGHSRRRYVRAYTQIQKLGFDVNKHTNISAFVKTERYYKAGKAPRMILGRDPRFNILYARFIEPVEKAFFQLPQVANACDPLSCGRRFSKLVGEWFGENDMTAYEGSQTKFHLFLEALIYTKLHSEERELLNILLALKMRKKCTTQSGVNFDFMYCRGSGDSDTSLGNGLLNYIATQYFLAKNFCLDCELSKCPKVGCLSYAFTVKGDDSYFKMPRFSENLINTYEDFGFSAKLETRKSAEDVEFCSGHFVEYAPGQYIYVQKLQKLIEGLTTCINREVVENGWVAHYYYSLGLMYKALYGRIPYYRDVAKFLLSTNCNFGLNVNLVTSYNLSTMFSCHRDKNFDVDESLASVSVSMVNKMDIGELNSLSHWFKTNRLCFSSEMQKRCNVRNKTTEVPRINWQELKTLVCTSNLPEKVYRVLNDLKSHQGSHLT